VDRQTGRLAHRKIDKWKDGRTKETYEDADRYTDSKLDRRAQGQTDRLANRLTEGYFDRKKDW
jgi:hypothetical protein